MSDEGIVIQGMTLRLDALASKVKMRYGAAVIDEGVTAASGPARFVRGTFSGSWSVPGSLTFDLGRTFKFGDIVKSRSGGYRMMVVRYADRGYWECLMFDRDMSKPSDVMGYWTPEEIEGE